MDPFKTSIIKSIKNEITEPLVIIFNKSLEEGNFPNLLKIAKVIPIYKEVIMITLSIIDQYLF